MNADTAIIVPIYNTECCLAMCLDSIKNQTYGDWCCLLADDGSTDRCGAIAASYAKDDSRFRVIHFANSGVASTRNKALDIVVRRPFRFVYLADSDDVLHPDLITLARKTSMAHPDVSAVRIDARPFIDDVEINWTSADNCAGDKVVISMAKDDFCESGGLCAPWRFFFNCGALHGVRYRTDFDIGEDLEFIAAFSVVESRKVAHLPVELYAYRQRPGSLVHCSHEKLIVRAAQFYELARAVLQNFHGDIVVRRSVLIPRVKQLVRMVENSQGQLACAARSSLRKLFAERLIFGSDFSLRWKIRIFRFIHAHK